MPLVQRAKQLPFTLARKVVPAAWRPRIFQFVENNPVFKSLHGEGNLIERELARSAGVVWTGLHDPASSIGMTERVIEVPWVLSRLAHERRVLDVGSAYAPRAYLHRLVDRGIPELHGVDLPDAAVPGMTMPIADVRQMPFEDEFFDAALCISTLEHIGHDNERYRVPAAAHLGEDVPALREIERTLRIGGRALLTVPFEAAGDYGCFKQYDYHAFEELVRSTGLSVADCALFKYTERGWLPCRTGEYPAGRYADGGAPGATAVLCAVLARRGGDTQQDSLETGNERTTPATRGPAVNVAGAVG